jgi:hypothetical protein
VGDVVTATDEHHGRVDHSSHVALDDGVRANSSGSRGRRYAEDIGDPDQQALSEDVL